MSQALHQIAPEVESFYHLDGVDIAASSCQGLACFVARHLNPERWNSAEGQRQRVYCLGKCYAGPASGKDTSRPAAVVDARTAIVLERIARGGARSLAAYRSASGYEALAAAIAQAPEQLIAAVEQSGLRGRGGAGFPTGQKWRAAAMQKSAEKHIVANADEGDPGAYIDRIVLEDDPHCLIEAMAMAGRAVGASRGWIYLRCEYPEAAGSVRAAIEEARRAGLLGRSILGSSFAFDIELVVGRGSYICGEETALLNSIEGQRPVAMARPPYATEAGLFGRPTVINNVETLANVPWIVRNSAGAYQSLGFSRSRGTKVVSLNSLFNRPGLYEVEFGVTVRHIVEKLGGGLKSGALKGVIIGGPLAGVIPPHLLDTPFGFDELRAIGAAVGHGGIIAFDERTSIPELVHHVFSFGAYESCGKCVPCRLGSRQIEQMFESAARRVGPRESFASTVEALKLASLCGLGTGLAEFAESILRYYPEELEPCFA
jgi:NADH:ubiquinone oxidoreductase subunit F (NADH-binding)